MTTLALGPSWLDPDFLLNKFGLVGLLIIVFAESGLLIGFFLPGDSLLFTTGLLVTTDKLDTPLWLVCTLVCIAAILGDQAGYLFGRKVGPALFNRPDSRFFKQENVTKAHEFFEKHGPKSLVLARFVPIVRTFTPIIAGVSRMNYRSFITYNVLGGILWGAGVTLLGAWLGQIDFVHKNIEAILILIVLISVLPIIVEFLRARSKSKKAAAEAPAQAPPANPAAQAPGVDHPTQQLHAHQPHQHPQRPQPPQAMQHQQQYGHQQAYYPYQQQYEQPYQQQPYGQNQQPYEQQPQQYDPNQQAYEQPYQQQHQQYGQSQNQAYDPQDPNQPPYYGGHARR
ncbi:DedA family protein [Streptomyces sp. Da 82-17]|uniref:DedA family protein n=1 Tax=Streptomyces sp. Da 82-17 TaxID=3377116 RepID=UPI0038D3D2FD